MKKVLHPRAHLQRFLETSLLTISVLIVSVGLTHAQNKPFPQAVNYAGCIKPSNVTQATLNSNVTAYYNSWKSSYLRNNLSSLPGGYYVLGEITGSPDGYTPLGSSEGQGYGMIITALMAGYDANAKTIFDGLFLTARTYHSSVNANLMGWVVADASGAQGNFSSASDGDFDIAYALLLAHYQWGSTGAINYRAEAINMITNGLKASNVTTNNRINLGDWDAKSALNTRPSDWMFSHMRAFHAETNDATWLNVINNLYSTYTSFSNTYSPTTKLVSDFIVGNPAQPAPEFYLDEFKETDAYFWNASRFPLRVVLDYALYGSTNAQTISNGMVNWIKTKTGSSVSAIRDGYELNGNTLGSYAPSVFVGPFVAASVVNSGNQAFLNSGWTYITNRHEDYFNDTYSLLCQLFISGNWWKPEASAPVTQSPYGGTVRSIPGKIEAEHYDLGGQAIAYNDLTAGNTGAVLRTDGVDIEATTDTGAGHNVGWAQAGEWLEYTVNVTTAGTYTLQARVAATTAGRTFHVELNGTNISGTITAPNTGGWQTWQTVSVTTTSLTTGQKVLRIVFDSPDINLNFINFTTVSSGQTPYGGTVRNIPGKIEAEHYDVGGQGVAFNETSPTNEAGATLRGDAVDIEACTDTGAGHNVGYIVSGEWLEYTVNVVTAGTYTLQARVATTASGKTFTVALDAQNLGTINVPNTGGWQTWQTVSITTPVLTTGQKILRFNFNSTDFNLNYVNFVSGSGRSSARAEEVGTPSVEAHPNPFHDNATITLHLANDGHTTVDLFEGTGRKIKELHNGYLQKGEHAIPVEGAGLPAGLYIYHVYHDGSRTVKKLIKQ